MQTKSALNLHPILTSFCQLSDDIQIRPKQASQILGVSIATLWRLIRDKKIPVNRLTPRTTAIRAGDLRAFMAGEKTGG